MIDDVLKNLEVDLEILERQSKQYRTFAEYYENAIKYRKALLLAVKTLETIDSDGSTYPCGDDARSALDQITAILGVDEVAK